jgi:hypothetical protein
MWVCWRELNSQMRFDESWVVVSVLALKHLASALWVVCVETFFICNVLSLRCVMWVERNICEHDKLTFRGTMVEIEVTYNKKSGIFMSQVYVLN